MRLDELSIGETAIVTALTNNDFLLKLVEMGFYEQKTIVIVAKSIGSDPICVQIGASRIMLRKSEAAGIIVEKCSVQSL